MRTKYNFLLFFGSITILIFSLLTAVMSGLAFVTVQSNMLTETYSVYYQPLAFGVHMNTVKMVISAIGGLAGLFALLEHKNKPAYVGFTAIAVASLGLILPAASHTVYKIPEVIYFDVPWIGVLLVLVGVSILFIGLALKKPNVPRITLLSVPLLLAVYLIRPLFVLFNFLTLSVFVAHGDVSWWLGVLTLAGHLLMLVGTIYAIKPSNVERLKTNKTGQLGKRLGDGINS